MIAFQDLIKAIHDAVLSANDLLVKKNTDIFDQYFEVEDQQELQNQQNADGESEGNVLKPRTVKISYPELVSDGIVHHEVSVPLISIMPLAFTQISQVKFKTKLEVLDVDNTIKVSFPQKSDNIETSNAAGADSDNKNYAELEIVIEPHKGSSGLNALVEGYEKMLRAQIPS